MRTRIDAIFRLVAAKRLVVAPLVFAALSLTAGDDITTSAPYGTFRMDTSGMPLAMASLEDTSILADWPISYRAGESVIMTAPDGTISTLAESSASAGAVAFTPTAGGLWRLENSNGDMVFVGVAWSVFDDAWPCVSGTCSPFRMHTVGEGPDRKAKSKTMPPIAYSGDDWIGDLSAAATLTFTSPDGTETVWNHIGTGAESFRLSPGKWMVRLEMADNTIRTAELSLTGIFMVNFR